MAIRAGSPLAPLLRHLLIVGGACLILAGGAGYAGGRRQRPSVSRRPGTEPLVRTVARLTPSVVLVQSTSAPGRSVLGAGFCLQNSECVVTAWHLVESGTVQVGVLTEHGYDLRRAQIIGHDEPTDIAILRVPGKLAPLQLSQSEQRPGESIATIGFPYGPLINDRVAAATSSGIVSCVRPISVGTRRFDVLQLDCLVDEGNSGGPVFSVTGGQVLGMVTTRLTPVTAEAPSVPIGFAVAAGAIRDVVHRYVPQSTATARAGRAARTSVSSGPR